MLNRIYRKQGVNSIKAFKGIYQSQAGYYAINNLEKEGVVQTINEGLYRNVYLTDKGKKILKELNSIDYIVG